MSNTSTVYSTRALNNVVASENAAGTIVDQLKKVLKQAAQY